MNVSVSLISYNGEKYIKQQIESILKQLDKEDELVISDDGSQDKTIEYVRSFNDPRIRIIINRIHGITNNVENALKECKNEVIILADQDDIWMPYKVKKIKDIFERKNVTAILHDKQVVNRNLIPIAEKRKRLYKSLLLNIIKNNFQGSCMAIRKEMLHLIFPIPKDIPMYDQWIGCINQIYGKTEIIQEKLILYRRHEETVTGKKNCFLIKVKYRKILIYEILMRIFNLRNKHA